MNAVEMRQAADRAERLVLDLVEPGHPAQKAAVEPIDLAEAAAGLAELITPRIMRSTAPKAEWFFLARCGAERALRKALGLRG